MVGFGLDYACAHIIILAEISSENLLPIRADFVTERVNEKMTTRSYAETSRDSRGAARARLFVAQPFS